MGGENVSWRWCLTPILKVVREWIMLVAVECWLRTKNLTLVKTKTADKHTADNGSHYLNNFGTIRQHLDQIMLFRLQCGVGGCVGAGRPACVVKQTMAQFRHSMKLGWAMQSSGRLGPWRWLVQLFGQTHPFATGGRQQQGR